MEKKLTIFTPTYNRKELIGKLYQSLKVQTNKNFVWLIVDDGSKDNTEALINAFKKENEIEIQYFYKENGGKNTAIDFAHEKCETDYIACVDSDDFLMENAVQNIYVAIEKIKNDKCVGIVGRKFLSNHIPLDNGDFIEGKEIMFNQLESVYNYKADTFLIFKTNIVKNFKFPKIEGEKFITEKVLYNQFMFDYSMLMINSVDYIVEYQAEGYSAGAARLMFNNPKGIMYAFKSDAYYLTKYKQGLKKTVLAWARFYAWRRLNKFNSLFKDELNIKSCLKVVGWILSFVMQLRYKNKKKNLK